MNNKIVVTHLN